MLAFGRDLQVSYRVWSPKSGYPGHGAYRDFHTYDHITGLKPARVTGRNVGSDDKAPYDPQRAERAGDRAFILASGHADVPFDTNPDTLLAVRQAVLDAGAVS